MRILYLRKDKHRMALYIHGLKKWKKMRSEPPITPFIGSWKSNLYNSREEYVGKVKGFYLFPFAFRITETRKLKKGEEIIFK